MICLALQIKAIIATIRALNFHDFFLHPPAADNGVCFRRTPIRLAQEGSGYRLEMPYFRVICTSSVLFV
jgi:hypothetical protein